MSSHAQQLARSLQGITGIHSQQEYHNVPNKQES